jgi:hypothetical protein
MIGCKHELQLLGRIMLNIARLAAEYVGIQVQRVWVEAQIIWYS